MTPFGTSWSGAVESSVYMVGFGRYDNTVTYKSPTFAGTTVYAQYSFGGNTNDEFEYGVDDDTYGVAEGHATATRYASLGATFKAGNLGLVGTVDWYNWSANYKYNLGDTATEGARSGRDNDDGFAVTLAGTYDFQVVKAYLAAQYFDNIWKQSSENGDLKMARFGTGINGPLKGYAVTAGVDAPVWGGTAMIAAGYTHTEGADDLDTEKAESDRWGVGVGYNYPLSKRTNVYAVAGYYQDKVTDEYVSAGNYRDRDPQTTTVMLGMRHRF